MDAMSEQDIVQAISNKQQSALNYVLDMYGNLIKSVINKHMRQLQMYQDECFNDVLLAIWDNIQKYDAEKSSLKNWIAGIARYKSLSYVRKHINEIANEDIDKAYDIVDDKTELKILELEHSQDFEQLIGNLSNQDKELFRRLYLYEHDVETVSHDMSLSSEVIYNRVSRGKKRLRLFLGRKRE